MECQVYAWPGSLGSLSLSPTLTATLCSSTPSPFLIFPQLTIESSFSPPPSSTYLIGLYILSTTDVPFRSLHFLFCQEEH